MKPGRKINPNSVQQRARINGLSEFTVYNRLNRGWTLEKALTPPMQGPKPNVASLARAAGLDPCTVRHRMRKQGMTLKMALHRPLQRRAKYGCRPQTQSFDR